MQLVVVPTKFSLYYDSLRACECALIMNYEKTLE